MRYPFASFSASLLIWLLIFISGGWIFFKKSPQVLNLNIDADMIDIVGGEDQRLLTKDDFKQNEYLQTKAKPPILPAKIPSYPNHIASQIKNKQGATPVYQPLPTIPDELRSEAFTTYAIARFKINIDGTAEVELIKPCPNPKLNYLLLQNLKKWRFSPARNDQGEAITTTQDIEVRFDVK